MAGEFRYRGGVISAAEVEFIRQLIAAHPGVSRRQRSLKLYESWAWRQANGTMRDGVCRGLLLMLYRAGEIALPAARWEAYPVQTWGEAGSIETLTHFFSAPSGIAIERQDCRRRASQPRLAHVRQLPYACSMPEPTNRALMEANGPEPGCYI